MSASRAVKPQAQEKTNSRARRPVNSASTLARQNGAANEDDAAGESKRKPETKKSPQMSEEDEHLRAVVRKRPGLDRKIIEGMLGDRKALMDELAALGVTDGAVVRRAAELGLSEALLRQVRGVAADLAGERPGRPGMPSSLGARTCLSCDRIFLSTGPGNRLCMRCRGGDAGLAQF